jgi:hypothetical protein
MSILISLCVNKEPKTTKGKILLGSHYFFSDIHFNCNSSSSTEDVTIVYERVCARGQEGSIG